MKRNLQKKYVFIVCLVLFIPSAQLFPDSFTNAIQDLAVRTACIGQYSATEAGGGWYDDPHDYYTPKMIAVRLSKESGNMTRTSTFYGVCFDYAQFAWNYVEQNKSWYKSQGLYEGQFWIAGVDRNSKEITLCYPGSANNYTAIQNGVYVKIPDAGGKRYVHAHGDATSHAWLWLESSDGVWFWVDPTWTDNLGYPIYGYIVDGEEVQCRPDSDYCVTSPSSLQQLPLPPAYGQKKSPSPTSNSTNREKTIKDAGADWTDVVVGAITKNLVDYSNPDNYGSHGGLFVSVGVPFTAFAGESTFIDKVSFGLGVGGMIGRTVGSVELDYLRNCQGVNNLHGCIMNINFGRRFCDRIGFYLGAGGGVRFDFTNKDDKPRDTKGLVNSGCFAFKVDAGLMFIFAPVFVKTEISYDNVTGWGVGFGLGIGL
ncbi:MAG: hypothetical protein IK015_10965 [Treponema sp.]|nr:hypothetical protein [Treponema sp.]